MSFAVNANEATTYTPALSQKPGPEPVVTTTTGDGGSGYTGDVNQASVFQETKFAKGDLTFDTSKLASGGLNPEKVLRRLMDMESDNTMVDLGDGKVASVTVNDKGEFVITTRGPRDDSGARKVDRVNVSEEQVLSGEWSHKLEALLSALMPENSAQMSIRVEPAGSAFDPAQVKDRLEALAASGEKFQTDEWEATSVAKDSDGNFTVTTYEMGFHDAYSEKESLTFDAQVIDAGKWPPQVDLLMPKEP